mmetsp:Transcript_178469/g.566222  ORF Transcript_178469/g.566222 Transcript_178469/m.566222 type:complete len:670 (-) Transcript_178469:136-2145(-)
MGVQTAKLCCHVEPLRQPRPTIAVAPIAGPRLGVQDVEVFEVRYVDADDSPRASPNRISNVRNRATGVHYACQRISKVDIPPGVTPHKIAKHLSVLVELEHPHLCKVVECFESESEYMLISEKAYAPPLLDFLAQKSQDGTAKVGDREAAEILRQVLTALVHCHKRGIVHGRLEPSCLLLAGPDGGGQKHGRPVQVKVSGIGLGCVLQPPLGSLDGATEVLRFACPEALWEPYSAEPPPAPAADGRAAPSGSVRGKSSKGSPSLHSASAFMGASVMGTALALEDGEGEVAGVLDRLDIWALGLLTVQLLIGFNPFASFTKREDLIHQIRSIGVKYDPLDWKNVRQDAIEVVQSMLKLSAPLRPTASELLRMPWLRLERGTAPWPLVHGLYRHAVINSKEGQFKKLIVRVVAEQLARDHTHLLDVSKVFTTLDKDRDGLLDFDEFREGLKHCPDLEAHLFDVVSLFEAIDRDGSRHLNLQEFAAATLPPIVSRNAANVWKAFRAFDLDQDGYITVEEVVQVTHMLEGSLLAAEQIQELSAVVQRELEGLGVARSRRDVAADEVGCWVQKHRPIDFEEFHFLATAREQKGLCGKIVMKTVYRFVNTHLEFDAYGVREENKDALLWPPKLDEVARTSRSVHHVRGGLMEEHKKHDKTKAKKKLPSPSGDQQK